MTTLVVKYYNMGPDNPHPADDIRALLASKPHVLGLCETIDYPNLPGVEGYKKWSDRSTRSRSNITVYTNTSYPCPANKHQWHDCKETWSRTEAEGTHEPRSWQELRYGSMQILVGHQPPKFTDNVHDSQLEGIDLLTKRMAPWLRDDWLDRTVVERATALDCPRIVLADWNRRLHESGPGSEMLCDRIDGWTAGTTIDHAVLRGEDAVLRDAYYVTDPKGHELGTDHPWGALVVKVAVDAHWFGSEM